MILSLASRKATITMKKKTLLVVMITLLILAFSLSALAGGKQKFTGEIGDAMCGRKHMEGTAAECTRACVKQGSKYALVIDDKIYALDTSDKAALATLDQLAGKRATVTGSMQGDNIEVSSVAAAK